MTTATVFNIQRFSLHDGPGIRTTVFLKGCPLRCRWCHNPESMDFRPEPMIAERRCIACGQCVPVCDHALTGPVNAEPGTNRPDERCERCGQCAESCPTEARLLVGQSYGAEELLAEILRDGVYHRESGGGVTFSGGEPLTPANAPLVLECLTALRRAGVHTTVDTCGWVDRDTLEQAAGLTDLFLFDLKIMDPERHVRATGRDNRLIHDNLRMLLGLEAKVKIRVPLIPGWTDDRENLKDLGRFLWDVAGPAGPPPVQLLPWHSTAAEKYERLGRANLMPVVRPLDDDRIGACIGWLAECGLTVRTGG